MHGSSQLISAHAFSNGEQPFEAQVTFVAAPLPIHWSQSWCCRGWLSSM